VLHLVTLATRKAKSHTSESSDDQLDRWAAKFHGGCDRELDTVLEDIATASRDKTSKVFDVAKKESLATFPGHADAVWSVALAPDGLQAVSGGRDRTICLWKLDRATAAAVLPEQGQQVEGTVDRAGRWIALLELGDFDGALEAFGDALRLDPWTPSLSVGRMGKGCCLVRE